MRMTKKTFEEVKKRANEDGNFMLILIGGMVTMGIILVYLIVAMCGGA